MIIRHAENITHWHLDINENQDYWIILVGSFGIINLDISCCFVLGNSHTQDPDSLYSYGLYVCLQHNCTPHLCSRSHLNMKECITSPMYIPTKA